MLWENHKIGLHPASKSGIPAARPRNRVASDVGAWRSLVARFVRDEEAVGSNPAAPTIKKASACGGFFVVGGMRTRFERGGRS